MVRILMSGLPFFRVSTALALLVLGTSCAELEKAQKVATDAARTAAATLHPTPAHWNDQGAKGPRKIVINLDDQRAFFLRGKTVVGQSNISTGKKGYETPPGNYRVIQKSEHHVSNLYGDFVGEDGTVVKANVSSRTDKAPAGTRFVGAKMPYFLRFTGGYGMHAGFVPRYRASHGCIRMPAQMAKHFFDAAELGTPVIVKE
jgi:lipoprotein-anchoring transpeptidase ErfK/SrfK